MAAVEGSAKGKKGKKGGKDQKAIDEYNLRRQLRKERRRQRRKERSMERIGYTVSKEDIMHHAENLRICGIEGGGTHSTMIVLDGKGQKLTEVPGPSLNHWLLGIDETAARISAMIEQAKVNLEMPEETPMHCVGLSLSGCEEEQTNLRLVRTLRSKYKKSARAYAVSSDTVGSLRTAMDTGGIVLIAGTGSNALLINPDGSTENCGGWGYMIGDEGSAYWIAHRACKYAFDDLDNFIEAPYPIVFVWPAIRNYFNCTDRKSMLPHLYTNFDKSKIALLTKQIVIGCAMKDPLCLFLFEEAGRLLAKHIIALSQKANNDLLMFPGGLKVVCVGSVWKSWKYLERGFVAEIYTAPRIEELTLLRLTTSSALGACYMAAEKVEVPFVKPYALNSATFYRYKRENYIEPQKEIPTPEENTKERSSV